MDEEMNNHCFKFPELQEKFARIKNTFVFLLESFYLQTSQNEIRWTISSFTQTLFWKLETFLSMCNKNSLLFSWKMTLIWLLVLKVLFFFGFHKKKFLLSETIENKNGSGWKKCRCLVGTNFRWKNVLFSCSPKHFDQLGSFFWERSIFVLRKFPSSF